jgi:gliding motility-associated lipoprotein GldH
MTKTAKRYLLAVILLAGLVATILPSCIRHNVYSKVYSIDDSGWSIYNQLIFPAPISDTLSPSDILLTIRSNSGYPYRNIFLFITTTSPEGYSIKDTIEYYLADEKGNWLGKGLGDIHELTVPFKTNVIFPYSGIYQFRVEQGMRTEDLEGIIDVGLSITKND